MVHNGFHESREVTTAAGSIPVKRPRVNDQLIDPVTGERKRFASVILPAWVRKLPKVAELLLLLYLRGLSPGDFGTGAVHRLRRRHVGLRDHPTDLGLARRSGRVQ